MMNKSLWADMAFKNNYQMVMSRLRHNSRHSKKREPNTPERLEFIREKYRNGVPEKEVEE